MNVHINPVSNTRYSGKNRIALEVFMKKRNFSVPKWITFYQAKQLGRKIKKGEHLIELGSGDGRATRYAVKELGVRGKGIDVNPFLVRWSNFLAKRQKLSGIEFVKENVFKSDLSEADLLYLFLMPEMLEELRPKFEKELKKGTQIISHGFKIPGLEQKLVKTLTNKPFSTYYYKL